LSFLSNKKKQPGIFRAQPSLSLYFAIFTPDILQLDEI